MEVLQGAIGKPNVPLSIDQVAVYKNADDLSAHLRSFRKELYRLSCKVRHMQDLYAIRDELMADAEQLVYLLTFR